jgi:hypothetical protein
MNLIPNYRSVYDPIGRPGKNSATRLSRIPIFLTNLTISAISALAIGPGRATNGPGAPTPDPSRLEQTRRAHRALILVALIEVSLFALYHWDQWNRVLRPKGTQQTLNGEGLVITGDGLGYYAWLRSLLIDGDWSFDNEFDEHNPLGEGVLPQEWRTELGLRFNMWSVGPACVWSLAVVPGHLLVQALQGSAFPWPADGYSLPYQLLVGGTSLSFSLLGLVLLYGICRLYARPVPAALAAALLTLGTTIIYYSSVEVTMAHGLGTTALAALVFYWLKSYGSTRPGRWFLVGLLMGLATLMRWQLASFAILLVGESLLTWWSARRGQPGRLLLCLGSASLGALLALSPQLVAWHFVYGHWLLSPMPLAHNWLSPSLWEVLGGQNRSLFYWTPLTALACAGFLYAVRPVRCPADSTCDAPGPEASTEPLVLLAVAFAIQVYLLASIRGTGVFLGSAYGFRQLTETIVILGPGLALWLDRAGPRTYRWLCMLGCVLALWNLLLVSQYCYYLIPVDSGASPGHLLANLIPLVQRKPHVVLGQTAAMTWLWFHFRGAKCGFGAVADEGLVRPGEFA